MESFREGRHEPGYFTQALGEQPLIQFGSATMLAGIDPEAEAKLSGSTKPLQKQHTAVISQKMTSRQMISVKMSCKIPILLNSQEYVDAYRKYRYEKVEFPLLTIR